MKKKVFVSDLAPGMYVCELDRPWLDSPFLLEGIQIESEEDIEQLKRLCEFVFIDPIIGADFTPVPRQGAVNASSSIQYVTQNSTRSQPPHVDAKVPVKKAEATNSKTAVSDIWQFDTVVYEDKAAVEEELVVAKEIHFRSSEFVRSIIQDVHNGRALDAEKVKENITSMVDSISRNPDAMLLLTKLREKDTYSYGHAIDVSIYMIAFGRSLGLPKPQLCFLGMGGLLLDVGKIKLPDGLLAKKGSLSLEEYALVKRHVEYGLEVVKSSHEISPDVLDIIANHHERQDGSGYPEGLEGDEISMYASMAGIVDCYQAITGSRPYAAPISPSDALQRLYDWKDKFFHGALVEQFIQCIGIYPVGSLVELNSGEVAIVIAQNRVRRLLPRVLVILDGNKKPYSYPAALDLINQPKTVEEIPYQIIRTLEYGMYGVDPREYYS
ncbi:HD-GYP domain-containing protein [Sulfurirhabdus autotrophica]|uniref:HD-GYP domain-containing protein (C-di-GMP phosphodiesterase class II) n=1 Tax=Sulfurirhabdus autotrophica TaxID=1706046 RepID=A0A4R3YEI1_9PROT|nr:HD-GYP domain-containing protein [Sulfurirhabdus autotrophica]TCV90282.1 HD-GYP domain-containing protein (c-di-GMP phosphodiesterase class II) [Sulfurirhabdus autotrophica]